MPLTQTDREVIERNVMLLKESMDIMHELVYFQGKDLDSIEDTIGVTVYTVNQGVETIEPVRYSGWAYAFGAAGAFGLSGLLTALFFLL